MSCRRRNHRRTQVAIVVLVVVIGVLALYGQRWLLRDAPGPAPELTLAQHAASAIYER
jgi:hypothetical protein